MQEVVPSKTGKPRYLRHRVLTSLLISGCDSIVNSKTGNSERAGNTSYPKKDCSLQNLSERGYGVLIGHFQPCLLLRKTLQAESLSGVEPIR